MNVAFHEIVGSELVRRIIDDGWFPGDELVAEGPVEGGVVLRRTGPDRVEITGSLQVTVGACCDRCCRPVQVPLAVEFFYQCIVGREPVVAGTETECRADDYDTVFLPGPVIDLGALFREQIYLALPARTLCRRDCKGLCRQCGADLNETPCSCRQPELSGPFAALRQLKRD